MSSYLRTPSAIGACVLLSLAGCGSEPAQLSPVRGTVYFQGLPLRGGTIVFAPDATRGGRGALARAEIQNDGTYVLRTEDKPGAIAGWHRVTVLAVQPIDAGSGRKLTVPRKYSDPELSGLVYEVKMEMPNTIDLRLE